MKRLFSCLLFALLIIPLSTFASSITLEDQFVKTVQTDLAQFCQTCHEGAVPKHTKEITAIHDDGGGLNRINYSDTAPLAFNYGDDDEAAHDNCVEQYQKIDASYRPAGKIERTNYH